MLFAHQIAIYSTRSAGADIINKGQTYCLDTGIIRFMQGLTLVSAQHQFSIRVSHIPGHKLESSTHNYHRPDPSPTSFSYSFQLTPQLQHLITSLQDNILNSVAPWILSPYLTGLDCVKSFHASRHLSFPPRGVLTPSDSELELPAQLHSRESWTRS